MSKGEKRECSVSIIICTHNRAHLLRRTLRSLTRQAHFPERYEVVVVDDGSVDDTAHLCETMRSELPNLRYIPMGANGGLAGARNRGIEVSAGDYVLFTDDDCIVAENWVERMKAALDRMPFVAGAVSTTVSDYVKLCHNIAEFHSVMPGRRPGTTRFIAGANMGMRRSVLEELSGFDPRDRHAEDMHLLLRARLRGYAPYFEPAAVVLHDPDRTTLRSIISYAAKHAAATIVLRNRYRSLLRTPFVLSSPFLLLVLSPLIALWVTAGIYLRNVVLTKFLHTAPVVFILKVAWCWGAARNLSSNAGGGGRT